MPTALPKLTAFWRQQEDALSRAIKTGRERAESLASIGFGLNRVNPSVIETRLSWWTDNATKARVASRKKAGDLVQPDWEKIGRDLEALTRSVGESTLRAFDEHLGQQALDCWDAWPVDTMLSRALLYYSIDIKEHVISGKLGCGAPYTPYIREAKAYDQLTPGAVTREEILRRGGTEADARRAAATGMVYRGGKRKKATPGWKMQFLRKVGGKWVFDTTAYGAGKEKAEPSPDRKKAKGHPYRDLIVKPAGKTAQQIGASAIAGALKGAP